ncbi:hypothetical protein HYALB_00004485 [Hymenoscyphus albidus]|uniref:Cytochrome P450 n=1 Tax=Hymenoscyphus albidus TaxID=595503 RepID=A0A9N9M3A8_9HELO|nr:hypothetical protein HYALB_00004485 [Hymenoscyphus albidus]
MPLLDAKSYVITSPVMCQYAFRSKDLSFEPHMVEFFQRMLNVSDATISLLKIPAGEKEASMLRESSKAIHESLTGENLHRTNLKALESISLIINGIDGCFTSDSLFRWLRLTLTLATSDALYGSQNPFRINKSLIESLWDFDAHVISFIMGIFPSFFVPKAHRGRAAVQAAFTEYFKNGYDLQPDVSPLVHSRAACYAKYGISLSDLGQLELAIVHVATANAIPTTFWTLLFIASSPTLTSLIRHELLTITKPSSGDPEREIDINIAKFSSHCPLLVSCYREVIRLGNSNIGARRVMTDTTITDGTSTYLLKAGCNVQIPSGVIHMSEETWGPNASTFDARRFLDPNLKGNMTAKEREEDRQRKKAYFPFGGGKHLCPGRNFAFAEILGLLSVLVLGFDIRALDGGLVEVPKMGRSGVAEGMVKPTGKDLEMGVRIERRRGWEDAIWGFVSEQ